MKVVLQPFQFLTNQSLEDSFNSAAFECHAYYGISIQGKVTDADTLDGSLKVQISNDSENWVDFTDFAAQALTADTDFIWVDREMIPVKYMRLVYTSTTGEGTLNVLIAGVRL
jgi:DNA/RNA-binding domain of Phe-tRNA-synthetase-like protein